MVVVLLCTSAIDDLMIKEGFTALEKSKNVEQGKPISYRKVQWM